jgi:cobalt-zinc-cadmium efflux system protein
MAHAHIHSSDNKRRVQIALFLTAGFMVVEVVGGVLSGSLALLADAGHMLTDTMALSLAAIAFHLSARPADKKRSYGYRRFEILAAFVNGITLLAIVIWIVVEAVRRFMSPVEVIGPMMLYVAIAGLLINLISFLTLHGGDQNNLNIRGAMLHVAGDLLGSVAAIVAAVVIIKTGWMPIDPILSIVVAAIMLKSAWHLIKRSSHILLEGVPEGLDVVEIRQRIVAQVDSVKDVHHLHVWGLTPEDRMLTMHIVLNDSLADCPEIVRKIKVLLCDDYGIEHSTIEAELGTCADE